MSVPHPKAIPSYRLHKATGQARVIIDGHHHYLGAYGSDESKAKYEELVRKVISDRATAEMQAREAQVRAEAQVLAAEERARAAEARVRAAEDRARQAEEWLERVQQAILSEFSDLTDQEAA